MGVKRALKHRLDSNLWDENIAILLASVAFAGVAKQSRFTCTGHRWSFAPWGRGALGMTYPAECASVSGDSPVPRRWHTCGGHWVKCAGKQGLHTVKRRDCCWCVRWSVVTFRVAIRKVLGRGRGQNWTGWKTTSCVNELVEKHVTQREIWKRQRKEHFWSCQSAAVIKTLNTGPQSVPPILSSTHRLTSEVGCAVVTLWVVSVHVT